MQRSGALFPDKPTPTRSNGEAVQQPRSVSTCTKVFVQLFCGRQGGIPWRDVCQESKSTWLGSCVELGTFLATVCIIDACGSPLPEGRERQRQSPGQQERWICCCADVLLPKTTLINTGSQNGGVINN